MQDLIPQLCVVKLPKQYVEAFCHGLREMLIVLERLHGGGLCCRPVVVMLDGEADDFVDTLLALSDMIRWRSETCYAFGLSIHLPYADLLGLLSFLLILIHSPGVVVTIVLLYRDLLYHCTIRSDSSTPCPCTITSVSV